MKPWCSALLLAVSVLWAPAAPAVQKEEGIVRIPSNHSVDQPVDKLKTILQSKGVTLIDHSGEAEKVGLKMPPTKLLIFGNPKSGTPLMLAAPSVAIDLPLKFWLRKIHREKCGSLTTRLIPLTQVMVTVVPAHDLTSAAGR